MKPEDWCPPLEQNYDVVMKIWGIEDATET
jgi:hypothetical protein